jgi:hypothetical protein
MADKKVGIKHKKSTISEKQYVKGMVHSLSLQRWTDQEISDYLHSEKQIDIARSTVTGIRNNIEKQAEKWYLELQKSSYKYIAVYKERLDSLMSYQKKLNQIIDFYLDPPRQILYSDTIIRAIAELHRIELSILNLWRELPTFHLQLDPKRDKDLIGLEDEPITKHAYLRCIGCRNWFKDNEILRVHQKLACSYSSLGQPIEYEEDENEGPSVLEFKPDGIDSVQCPDCERWFKDDLMIKVHDCSERQGPES